MDERNFPVDLVTPEALLLEGVSSFVAIPAWNGEMGFAFLRAPVMVSLGAGEMRVHMVPSGEIERFVVKGGFAGTDGSHLVVLATRAQRLKDFDSKTLKERCAELEQRIAESNAADRERAYLVEELDWLRLALKVASLRNL